jgi:hypothetical protein
MGSLHVGGSIYTWQPYVSDHLDLTALQAITTISWLYLEKLFTLLHLDIYFLAYSFDFRRWTAYGERAHSGSSPRWGFAYTLFVWEWLVCVVWVL